MIKTNPILFEEARRSKVLLNGVFSTILSFVMIILGQLIGSILLVLTAGLLEIKMIMRPVFFLIFTFVFPLILCFLWVKFVEKRKISSLGLGKKKFISKFLIGFLIGFLMFSAVVLMMYISGAITLRQSFSTGVKLIPGILLILPGWIIQSSTEEIITRGWLMHIVGARHKPIIGYIVSSVLFGLLHVFNPEVSIIPIINIILVGMLLGLYVMKTEDVWGVCGLHAAWNFSQGNIYGFSVSGLDIMGNSLLAFADKGSVLLTGGKFGPEASIFSTIVLGISIIILIVRFNKKAVN